MSQPNRPPVNPPSDDLLHRGRRRLAAHAAGGVGRSGRSPIRRTSRSRSTARSARRRGSSTARRRATTGSRSSRTRDSPSCSPRSTACSSATRTSTCSAIRRRCSSRSRWPRRPGFKFWKPLIWDKCTIGMGYHYRARYECILFFEKGKRKLNDLGIADIIEVPRIRGGYPAEKPVRGRRGADQAEHRARARSWSIRSWARARSAWRRRRLGRRFLGNDLCRRRSSVAARGWRRRTRARLYEEPSGRLLDACDARESSACSSVDVAAGGDAHDRTGASTRT